MSRELSLPLRDNLQLKKQAVEPVIVLGIEWTPGNEILYSDRKINGTDQAFPILNDMSQFSTSQIVSGSGSSQNVSFVLNDTLSEIEGHLEELMNTVDVHKAKARVYLMVQGTALIDRTLLFQGEINSPLEWDEGDRTLSFTIISDVESVEAGFAIEDGDFPLIPEELRGKPWPMVFGEVCWEKTVQVRAPRKGFLEEGQGVPDFTIRERLCQARFLTCAQKYDPPRTDDNPSGQSFNSDVEAAGCMSFRDNKTGDKGCICPDLPFGTCPDAGQLKRDRIDFECLTRRFNEICKLITRLSQEEDKVVNPMLIRGGENFPQDEVIRINVDGVIFVGIMTGTSFAFTDVIHPQRDEISNPPCKAIFEAKFGLRGQQDSSSNWTRNGSHGRDFTRTGPPINATDCANAGNDTPIKKVVEGPGESWRYYELFEAADFIWLPAGTEVYLEGEEEILHIVNLFGGTVTGVAAYRDFEATTLLLNLPTDYFEVRITNYGDDYPTVSEIAILKPLKTYKDEEWENDVYVKVVSPVGPNPADCIKFLVDTYLATSGITMDLTSYNSVRTKVEKYPIGSMVTDRPSVFNLIADIAYQSRMAAVIRDGEMVLIYLSEKPTAIRTLTEADIVPESVRITHGDTEDLKTRHDINWSKFGASNNKDDDPARRILLKWNIPLYGTFDVKYDYYTQNTFETILKSATFWIIREATTWKIIHFETPLTQIDLDVFDAIALDIPHFTSNTTVIVEDASYDANTSTIKFRCWTPIRAGEEIEYIWAWPAQQDANEIFPLQGIDDGREGDALGFTVSPPLGHVLRGGFVNDDVGIVQTTGDRNPSDLDDVLPELNCPDANDVDIEIPLSVPEFDDFKEIANRQDDHFENNQDSMAGGGASTEDDSETVACGVPSPSDVCTYEVTVENITPKAVTTVTVEGTSCPGGGPCGCPGPTGRPCFGPTSRFCHTFSALFAAQQFRNQKQAEADDLFDNCGYQCGKGDIWQVFGVKAIPATGAFGACDDTSQPGDPEADGNKDGQVAGPTPV